MPANEVLTVMNGQSLVVTFNRPEQHNRLTLDMANQVFTILKNATTDRAVRAVMLCGSGHHFMGGLEMAIFGANLNVGLENHNQIVAPYHSAIRELQAMDKPVLACVEGEVYGAGLSFMLASDFVFAARSTRINAKFAEFAMSPSGGCSYFLPRKIGLAKAVELLILGDDISAEDAEKLGLVNKVVDDEKLQDEAMAFVTRLAQGPTKAYGAVKKLALRSFEMDLNAHMSVEHTYMGHCVRSFDFRDYVRAKTASKDPTYTGT